MHGSLARRIAVLLVVVAVLVAGRFAPRLFDGAVDREDVEKAGLRAMIYSGVGATTVSCPGDLDRSTGATIVCEYTDGAAEAARAVLMPDAPPKLGRVEVRIAGFRRSSDLPFSTSEPEFEARVIEPVD